MSGFHTHMLIGAVGGLAAFRVIQHLTPSILSLQFRLDGSTYPIPTAAVAVGCVTVSSVAAVWPDLDEPGSWISHVVARSLWLLGGVFGMMFAFAASHMAVWMAISFCVGAVVGLAVGRPLLSVLRLVAGGHRKLTHSVLLGISLLIGAAVLYLAAWGGLGLLVFILAWGLFLHLAGDVVTPGGVALLYPIWTRDIHLLPHSLSRFGEVGVGGIALVLGLIFIRF